MNNQFLVWSLGFFIGFLIRSLFSQLLMIGSYIKIMQVIELKFLLLSANYIKWKSHAVTILDVTYEKLSEDDPKLKEEQKITRNKIEEKFQETGEEYIKALKEILPYKPKYNNWNQALKHLQERLKQQ